MIGFGKLSFDKVRPGVMVLELIVIVLGISASFWVDEWREKKQDTETFNRIIGEVYYGLAVDNYELNFNAMNNNEAVILAGNLAVKDKPLPEPEALFEQLNKIFEVYRFTSASGAYERLVNTSLTIPINQTQTALDRGYNLIKNYEQENDMLFGKLQELGEEYFFSQGVVPCRNFTRWMDPERDKLNMIGMMNPSMFSIRNEEDECLTNATNHEISMRLMASESFKVALLRAINIRQLITLNYQYARGAVETTRERMLVEHPHLTMPIQSIQLVNLPESAKTYDERKVYPLQKVGPVEWQGTITLVKGFMSINANNTNTMFWGLRPPWVRRGIEERFDIENKKVSWFPTNKGYFRGWMIEVGPGTYDLQFNSQTYEYHFEPVEQEGTVQ